MNNMTNKVSRYLSAMIVSLLVLSACSRDEPESTTQQQDSAESSQMQDQQALNGRAEARWKAIMAEDYEAAYKLETPTYRRTYDQIHFMLQFAGQVRRKSVGVEKIEFDQNEPTLATVVMNVHFIAQVGGQPIESTTYFRESWIKLDGQWWHLSKQ